MSAMNLYNLCQFTLAWRLPFKHDRVIDYFNIFLVSPDLYIVILTWLKGWLHKVFQFSMCYILLHSALLESSLNLNWKKYIAILMQRSAVCFFVFSKWLLAKIFLKKLWKLLLLSQSGILKVMSFKADLLADNKPRGSRFLRSCQVFSTC